MNSTAQSKPDFDLENPNNFILIKEEGKSALGEKPTASK